MEEVNVDVASMELDEQQVLQDSGSGEQLIEQLDKEKEVFEEVENEKLLALTNTAVDVELPTTEAQGYVQGGSFVPDLEAQGYVQGGNFTPDMKAQGYVQGGSFNPDVEAQGYIQGGSFIPDVEAQGYIQAGSFIPDMEAQGYVQGGNFTPDMEAQGYVQGGDMEAQGYVQGVSFTPDMEGQGYVQGGNFSPDVEAQVQVKGGNFAPAMDVQGWAQNENVKPNMQAQGQIRGEKFKPNMDAQVQGQDKNFKPKMEELLRHLQPKDLKKILDKVSGRHKRHHSWTQSSEHEDKDGESRFVTPLQDHDELTRCMECNRKHTTPNGLFWHLDVKHKWSFQLTRLKATTSCPICNVYCGHWYNMSLHVIQAHGQRNWWKEGDDSIMLIQPAQTDMEESVTKLDKPVDRRLSLILSQSMDRHSPGNYIFGGQDSVQQVGESNLTMHDSVDTMVRYGSTVLPEKIDEEQAEGEINSPFEQGEVQQDLDLQKLVIHDGESPRSSQKQYSMETAVSSEVQKTKKVSSRGLSFRFWGTSDDKTATTALTLKSGSLPQPIIS